MIPFLYPERDTGPVTFAEPGEAQSFGEKLREAMSAAPLAVAGVVPGGYSTYFAGQFARDQKAYSHLFGAAERQTRLVDNMFAEDAAREEAYDRRIKAVKDATGVTLENPVRRGYQREAKKAVRDDFIAAGGTIDETGGIPAYRYRIFDSKFSEVNAAHPDKMAALTFGNIDEEARAIARGAEEDYEHARTQPVRDPITGMVTEFAGAMYGMRRDPLFIGSLFFGPTSAAGRTVAARILSSGLRQGFFNAGLSALEQPVVQAWRNEIGVKSGIVPAIQNVGMAFAAGLIPGAILRGVHEANRLPIRRVLEGNPQPGDLEKAMETAQSVLKEIDADIPGLDRRQTAAVRLGEQIDEADLATRPPPNKAVSPELHDDLTVSAQRYGEDPTNQPSPAAVSYIDAYHGSPHDFALIEITHKNAKPLTPAQQEISDRIADAKPKTLHDAQMAATEAIEDIGNRNDIAHTEARMASEKLPTPEPPPEGTKLPPARSKDPLDKVPMVRDDGSPVMASPQQVARAGEREMQFADIIRECK